MEGSVKRLGDSISIIFSLNLNLNEKQHVNILVGKIGQILDLEFLKPANYYNGSEDNNLWSENESPNNQPMPIGQISDPL